MLEINKTRSQCWGQKVGTVCGKRDSCWSVLMYTAGLAHKLPDICCFFHLNLGDHLTWPRSRGIPIITIKTQCGLTVQSAHLSTSPFAHPGACPSNVEGTRCAWHLELGTGNVKGDDTWSSWSGSEARNVKSRLPFRALVHNQGRL